MLFQNRTEAGKRLAAELHPYANHPDVLVLGLPRGGVPVAYEVARELNAALDVFLVRKLGVPNHRELAMGAIASGGTRILNEDVVRSLDITSDAIETVAAEEQRELERREIAYRGDLPPLDLRDRTVILVDDGVATGASMRVATIALQKQQPKRAIVAVPVAAKEVCDRFRSEVDEILCLETPDPFMAVGVWYDNFSQTSDREVCELLHRASHQQPATSNK